MEGERVGETVIVMVSSRLYEHIARDEAQGKVCRDVFVFFNNKIDETEDGVWFKRNRR